VFPEIDVHLPSFSSHSYLEFAGRLTSSLVLNTGQEIGREEHLNQSVTSSLTIQADIELVFRPSAADGLLLFSGLDLDL